MRKNMLFTAEGIPYFEDETPPNPLASQNRPIPRPVEPPTQKKPPILSTNATQGQVYPAPFTSLPNTNPPPTRANNPKEEPGCCCW